MIILIVAILDESFVLFWHDLILSQAVLFLDPLLQNSHWSDNDLAARGIDEL